MILAVNAPFLLILLSSTSGSPAVHVSVLMLDGQTGELALQLAKARLGGQIGAQEQSTQNVSVRDERGCKEAGNCWRVS